MTDKTNKSDEEFASRLRLVKSLATLFGTAPGYFTVEPDR